MTEKRYLGVDLGAESGRTVVGSFDGKRLHLRETHRFPNTPVRALGTIHWDILRLWHEIKRGMAESVKQVGTIHSIGVDTWGVDFALLDETGGLLANPIHYRDKRTDGMLAAAFEMVPKAEIYERTGLQFLSINSLFQLLAVSRTHPRLLSAASRLSFIPDLLTYWMTGNPVCEYTIASTSQMLDPRTKDWARDMLTRLGIPGHLFHEVSMPGKDAGALLAAVSDETGAMGARVMTTAGHDTAAAVAAIPAVGDRWCYISSGTWSLMGSELDQPSITEQGLADNFTNEGGVGGTIRFLKNIVGMWLVQECRRSFEKQGTTYDYATLAAMAAGADPFAAFINPDHPGFVAPDDMPTAIGEFCQKTGQTPPTEPAAFVRTCLEGLAFRYRRVLEQLEANTGRSIDTIHIVGGGSQNAFLCQMTADCCQRRVVAGPVEATAMGNCLVQAMADGEVADLAEIREIVRQSSQPVEYVPLGSSASVWEDAMGQWRKLTGE